MALTLAGLGLAVYLAFQSDGFYQDDDAGHYDFAARGWTSSSALWHVWARPGYNLLAAVAAHFWGFVGCRILSAVQTAIIAYLAYGIARRILSDVPRGEFFAALAPVLVWAQPLSMTLAITSLTETPAGLYLTLAVWLYMRSWPVQACLALGMVFVTRFETLPLGGIFAVAIVYDSLREAGWKIWPALAKWKLWACGCALLLAPAIYIAVAIWLQLPSDASPLYMFSQQYTNLYGHGSWTHYLFNYVQACGVGVVALAVGGAVCFARRAMLPIAMCAGLLGIETIIFVRGSFASGGYARFLVPIAGLTAVVASAGLAGLMVRTRALAAMAVLLVIAASAYAYGDNDPYLVGRCWGQLAGVVRQSTGLAAPAWPAHKIRMAMIILAGGIAVLSACAAIFRRGRLGTAMRITAISLAGVLAIAEGVAFARPLMLDSTPMDSLLAQVSRQEAVNRHAGLAGITSHAVMPMIRPNTQLVLNPREALQRWLASPPGTLLFWDSKYCAAGLAGDNQSELADRLKQGGVMIAKLSNGSDTVEAYVRSQAQPAAP
jgi:hypothetical protein